MKYLQPFVHCRTRGVHARMAIILTEYSSSFTLESLTQHHPRQELGHLAYTL